MADLFYYYIYFFCDLSYCVDFNDVRFGVDEPFLSRA